MEDLRGEYRSSVLLHHRRPSVAERRGGKAVEMEERQISVRSYEKSILFVEKCDNSCSLIGPFNY